MFTDMNRRIEVLKYTLNTLKKYHIALTHISKAAGISDTFMSLFLKGERGISEETLSRMEKAVAQYAFIVKEAE